MLEALIEEERRQDDMQNQRTSWATSHIMNSSGNYKKPIKPTDLYKPMYMQEEEEPLVVERFNSNEQKEEYLDNLMKKFGKEFEKSDDSN